MRDGPRMADSKRHNWREPPELRERTKEFQKPQTLAEDALWDAVRGQEQDSLKFRRQHPIQRAIADFCCPHLKLIVEVDGSVHNEGDQAIHDHVRDEWLVEQGYTIIRFTNTDIEDHLQVVLNQIKQKAKSLSHQRERDGPGQPEPE